jgi:L-arabinose isomerase
LTGRARLEEMAYKFSDAENPVRALGCLRGGPAVFVNLAPLAGNRFRLIITSVTMQTVRGEDRMKDSIHGWFRPSMPVADFLAAYSRAGGTHHAALVYAADLNILSSFGALMGWETIVIEPNV